MAGGLSAFAIYLRRGGNALAQIGVNQVRHSRSLRRGGHYGMGRGASTGELATGDSFLARRNLRGAADDREALDEKDEVLLKAAIDQRRKMLSSGPVLDQAAAKPLGVRSRCALPFSRD